MQPTLQITSANLFDLLGRVAPAIALLSLAPSLLLVLLRRGRCSPVRSALALEGIIALFIVCSVALWMNAPRWTIHSPIGFNERLLGAIWVAGAAVSIALRVVELLRLGRTLRNAELLSHPSSRVYALPHSLASHGALVFQNRIYLDREIWGAADAEILRSILAHENAHLKHHHWTRSIINSLVGAIFWWVLPLRWTLSGLRGEYESTADSIAGASNLTGYIESLLWLARRLQVASRVPEVALGIAGQPNHRWVNHRWGNHRRGNHRWDRLQRLVRPEEKQAMSWLSGATLGMASLTLITTSLMVSQLRTPKTISVTGASSPSVQLSIEDEEAPSLTNEAKRLSEAKFRVIYRN